MIMIMMVMSISPLYIYLPYYFHPFPFNPGIIIIIIIKFIQGIKLLLMMWRDGDRDDKCVNGDDVINDRRR